MGNLRVLLITQAILPPSMARGLEFVLGFFNRKLILRSPVITIPNDFLRFIDGFQLTVQMIES